MKTSEAVAQVLVVPKEQSSIQDTHPNNRFHKKKRGSKSGKSKKKEKKCGKKKGKKGCHDSGDDYWEFFAPSVSPGALEPRPWSSPVYVVEVPAGSVDTSQHTPTYGNSNPTASPIHLPTTGTSVELPTGSPVTSTNPLGTDTPASSSSTNHESPEASEPSPTKPDILTEQVGNGDDTGLLSACANHPPETSANTEMRVLAFEYVMLVVPGTTSPSIESIVHEVEEHLHEILAKELLRCVFSSYEEFNVLLISSLPKDFISSKECAEDEKRDNTDCHVIAGIFTVKFLKGRSFDGLLSGLTRLMKDYMPPNVRRELVESLSVAGIDPNLKGLIFRGFVTPFDDTAGVDNEFEQPDHEGSSKTGRAIAGASIVGSAAAIAIVVGFLSVQRRRRSRAIETSTIGIKPRTSDSFSTQFPTLPILYGPHENGSHDMSAYTTTIVEPSDCGGNEKDNSDCEKTHNSIPCDVTSKMYDMSVITVTGLEPSACGASENGNNGWGKSYDSIPCEMTSEIEISVLNTTGLETSGCGANVNGDNGCEKTYNSIPSGMKSGIDMSEINTTGLEPSKCGGRENSNNDCEETHNHSISFDWSTCRKVLFSQNSIELDKEIV